MKKVTVSGKPEFVPSATDKARAMSHARAMARRAAYDGEVVVFLDRDSGVFYFCEIVGLGYIEAGRGMEYIGSAPCCA